MRRLAIVPVLLAALTAPLVAQTAATPGPGVLPQAARAADSSRAALTAALDAPVPDEIPVALLVDLSSHQILFAREAGRRFMPASVTKVMTAYTAFRLISEGKLSPATHVTISDALERDWSGEGSSMFLLSGETPTIGQLLMGTTTVSGNDATVAIADAVSGSVAGWTELMNRFADQLGMSESHFFSPNGYPDGGRTFTSAHDLALLGEALVTRYPALYGRYFGNRRMQWRGIVQYNHDPITGKVAGADGLKTGFTNEAGYTFVGSAERGRRRLILVLAGSPTSNVRNKAARDLMEWGFDRFASRPLFAEGALLGEARVQDGRSDTVLLRAPRAIAASIPQGQHEDMHLSIHYRGPISAPIAKGEQVATLRIEMPGFEPAEVPLEAADAVPRANAWYRLVNGLYGMFA